MAEVVDLLEKRKRYIHLTPAEISGLSVAIVAIGFIISFKDWGPGKGFDFSYGLYNLFLAIIIVGISILIRVFAEKIWALAIGYRIEFRMSATWIFAGIIVAFITNGNFWVIVPGGFIIHHLAGARLGFFRYDINYFAQAMIAWGGTLSTLVFIILLKIINYFAASQTIEKAIIFNVIYLITSLIPIPPLEGSKIFFGSRMAYAFLMPAMLTAAILLMIKTIPIIVALIFSLLIAIILWIAYYFVYENKIWRGAK